MGEMKRLLLPVFAGFFAWGFLSGCSKPDPVLGKWKFQDLVLDKPNPKAPTDDRYRKMLAGGSTEFKADHTFSQSLGKSTVSGTWTHTGDTVTMTKTLIDGTSVAETKAKMLSILEKRKDRRMQMSADALDRPMVGTLSSDAKTLTVELGGTQGAHLVFGR